jgi:hypothetical protein
MAESLTGDYARKETMEIFRVFPITSPTRFPVLRQIFPDESSHIAQSFEAINRITMDSSTPDEKEYYHNDPSNPHIESFTENGQRDNIKWSTRQIIATTSLSMLFAGELFLSPAHPEPCSQQFQGLKSPYTLLEVCYPIWLLISVARHWFLQAGFPSATP